MQTRTPSSSPLQSFSLTGPTSSGAGNRSAPLSVPLGITLCRIAARQRRLGTPVPAPARCEAPARTPAPPPRARGKQGGGGWHCQLYQDHCPARPISTHAINSCPRIGPPPRCGGLRLPSPCRLGTVQAVLTLKVPKYSSLGPVSPARVLSRHPQLTHDVVWGCAYF